MHGLSSAPLWMFLLLASSSSAFGSVSDPVHLRGEGTWEAGKASGSWVGKFVISPMTGIVSGALEMSGLGKAGRVNEGGRRRGDVLLDSVRAIGGTAWNGGGPLGLLELGSSPRRNHAFRATLRNVGGKRFTDNEGARI